MKRYIKYGLILMSVIAVLGMVFYLIKKPKESVIINIPADVTLCISIDKRQIFKEAAFLEEIEKDSLFQRLKAKIPADAITIYNEIGLNPLGDLAVFSENNSELNLAWVGENEEKLTNLIAQKKWPKKNYKNFNQVKISDKLTLNYRWPLVVLSTSAVTENFEFFNPLIKKLTKKELQHPKTDGSLIYGFIIPGRNFLINYPFLPLYGRAFVGLKREKKKTEIFFIQRRVKLQGKLGIPKKEPLSYALLSWPMDLHSISAIKQIPTVVVTNLNQVITKPVKNIYVEILDTFSTVQKIIQYDMDANFQLTQKIIDHYKIYPGLRLEFMKMNSDSNSANEPKPNNLGLDIFKLGFNETKNSYIIASEDKPPRVSEQNMPDYYFYANLTLLKTDPFWEFFSKTTFQKIQLHAENYGKGSLFVLTLEKN